MEELKKEFAKMNVSIKTDLEILTELVDKYKQPDLSEDQIRTILKDLEYYLHQVRDTYPVTLTCMCTDTQLIVFVFYFLDI